MKIFVSWSGERSRVVAEIVDDWISCVLQASDPWISTRDIDRGALWFSEISDQLANTNSGIICLTQENKNRPWVLFEAGALAKGLSTSRVCTLLIDLQPTDLEDPLAQLNHTFPNKASMRALVGTLNARLGEQQLEDRLLDRIFDTYWPQFEADFAAAIADTPTQPAPPARSDKEILTEILESTRSLGQRIRKLEEQSAMERSPRTPNSSEYNQRLIKLLRQNIPKTASQSVADIAAQYGISPRSAAEVIENANQIVEGLKGSE